VVGKNGTVFVSYLRENVATVSVSGISVNLILRIDIVVVRSTDGGATFSTEVVPTRYAASAGTVSIATASPPVLALDSNDNPFVTWAGAIAGRGTDIYVARSRDGGATFDTAVNASNYANLSITPRQPSVAVDANNVVYVAWVLADIVAGTYDVWLAASPDATKYTIANLSNATYYSGTESDWPALQADPSGGVVAVWREWLATPYRLNDTQRDIFFARCASSGTSCSTPINISSSLGDTVLRPGSGPVQAPGLAVNSCGTAYVFYDDDTSGSTQAMVWSQPGAGCPGPK